MILQVAILVLLILPLVLLVRLFVIVRALVSILRESHGAQVKINELYNLPDIRLHLEIGMACPFTSKWEKEIWLEEAHIWLDELRIARAKRAGEPGDGCSQCIARDAIAKAEGRT